MTSYNCSGLETAIGVKLKAKSYHLLFRLGAFLFGLIFITGCASQDKYRYENIRRGYHSPSAYTDDRESSARHQNREPEISQPLSLERAVQIAKENNPDSRMAMARIKQAQAMIDRSNAAFYPSFGFYTEYLQADAPSIYLAKTLDQRSFLPGTDFNYPGRLKHWESGLDARWNIYNGGRDVLNKKISRSGLTISGYDRQDIEIHLVTSVSQTYFDCLAAQKFVAISKESVATVEEQLRVTKIKFDAGGALKSDLLSLEVRYAEAREDVVRSNNRLRTLLTALTNIMGVTPNEEIQLEGSSQDALQIPEGYQEAIEFALQHRPDLKRIRQQVVQSRMALDLAETGYMPSVDVFGKLYLADEGLSYDWDRRNWATGVLLNWDFFTGFSTKADRSKASASLEEMLAVDRKTVLNAKFEVKNAYLNLDEASARLEVVRKSVASAEESLKLVKLQYEGGSATITRYLEAELDRNRAKISATAAFFDHQKAIYEIGRSIGYWHAESENNDQVTREN